MSPYYKYEFVSPEPLIALIKEELKSYIDTGAIDDSIWSIYVDKCLKKLGRGSLKIGSTILEIVNYQATLPDEFHSVREAWLSTQIENSFQLPSAVYESAQIGSTSTLLSNSNDALCSPCNDCDIPDVIKLVYKTTFQVYGYFRKDYLLKPGNVNALRSCAEGSPNISCFSPDSFDINGNKFVTNFSSGTVYILYYYKEYDEQGYQLIPDDFRIQEYIEAFIKQKVFEQLSNQTVDETYNQIQQKATYYKQLADEAFIMASVESKKETIYEKHRKAIREKNRFNKYLIR